MPKEPEYYRDNLARVTEAFPDKEVLTVYEDTGLEPEKVEQTNLALMGKSLAEIKEFDGIPIDHLQELVQAEKDGRLVVLAVLPEGRPGYQTNTVYVIDDGEIYDDSVVGAHIGVASSGEFCCLYETYDGHDFYATDIGKTVFLTEENAEGALKKREEG